MARQALLTPVFHDHGHFSANEWSGKVTVIMAAGARDGHIAMITAALTRAARP